MNCQEALELLYDYIDKEASDLDVSAIQQHLNGCRHCFEKYRLEESVQALINARAENLKETPNLGGLQANILSRLDEIDSGAGKRSSRIPFFRPSTILVLAASLVLVIAASFLASDFYRHNEVYMPLERAHWKVADNLEDFNSQTTTASIMNSLASDAGYALDRVVGAFHLTGGHREELMGVQMAHFAYTDGQRLVSVFVVPASEYSIPSDLEGTGVQYAGVTLYDHHCRDCRLVFHRIGDVVIITATSDRSVDLIQFLPGRASI